MQLVALQLVGCAPMPLQLLVLLCLPGHLQQEEVLQTCCRAGGYCKCSLTAAGRLPPDTATPGAADCSAVLWSPHAAAAAVQSDGAPTLLQLLIYPVPARTACLISWSSELTAVQAETASAASGPRLPGGDPAGHRVPVLSGLPAGARLGVGCCCFMRQHSSGAGQRAPTAGCGSCELPGGMGGL